MTDTIDLTNGHHTVDERLASMEQQVTQLAEALDTAHTETVALRAALEDQRRLTLQAEAATRQARAEGEAAVTRVREEGEAKLEEFKVRASEILGDQANDHDLCETYDNIAESAGLYRRMRSQDVDITVTYRQTITVQARSWEEACEQVRGMTTHPQAYRFVPPSPFTSTEPDFGSVFSIDVEVSD